MTNILTKNDDFIIETVIRTNNMRERGSGFGAACAVLPGDYPDRNAAFPESESANIAKHDRERLTDKINL